MKHKGWNPNRSRRAEARRRREEWWAAQAPRGLCQKISLVWSLVAIIVVTHCHLLWQGFLNSERIQAVLALSERMWHGLRQHPLTVRLINLVTRMWARAENVPLWSDRLVGLWQQKIGPPLARFFKPVTNLARNIAERTAEHPTVLYILGFIEAFERFSFYGMRALLVLYLVKKLGWSDEAAHHLYGRYGALVYAAPVLGGFIADRVLGQKKTIFLGGLLMAIGHFVMGLPGETALHLALAFLVVGNGGFKPNISTLVGKLYDQLRGAALLQGISIGKIEEVNLRLEALRDRGFALFYVFVNGGALAAPIGCGYVGEVYGWHYGFALAGVFMVIGLVVLRFALKYLEGLGDPPNPKKVKTPCFLGFNQEQLVWIGALALVGVVYFLVQSQALVGYTLTGSGIMVGGFLVGYVLWGCQDQVERDQLKAALIMIVSNITFWSFFEQAGSSLNLFTDRYVNKHGIAASVFQSVNPSQILVFTFLIAGPAWAALRRRGKEPSIPTKFGIGMVLLAIGFAVLYGGAAYCHATGQQVPVWIILVSYGFQSLGELCLSPVGLSMITKLAPKKIAGLMMGAWFLSSSFAHYIAGIIAAMTGGVHGNVAGNGANVMVYGTIFGKIAVISAIVGLILFAASKRINRLMHGVK